MPSVRPDIYLSEMADDVEPSVDDSLADLIFREGVLQQVLQTRAGRLLLAHFNKEITIPYKTRRRLVYRLRRKFAEEVATERGVM